MKKKTGRQIAAIGCIIILLLLYIVTLAAAVCDFEGAGRLFQICLALTIVLPILLWGYIWMYGKLTNKHTIASLDILGGDAAGRMPEEAGTEDFESDREQNGQEQEEAGE